MPDVIAGAVADLSQPHGYTRAPTAGASVDYLPYTPPVLSVTAGAVVDTGPITPHPVAGAVIDYIPGPHVLSGVQGGAVADLGAGLVHVQGGAVADLGAGLVEAKAGASADYIPGDPNTSCPVAAGADFDHEYGFTAVIDGPHYWWVLPDCDPGLYEIIVHVDSAPPGPGHGHVRVNEGTSCDDLTLIHDGPIDDVSDPFFKSAGFGPLWVEVYAAIDNRTGRWKVIPDV